MSTRATIRGEVQNRLQDASATVWTVAELNGYIDQSIKSAYPTYFQLQVDTTLAGNGPLQPMPSECRNVYYIGLQKPTSTRVRLLRQWREGTGFAHIPKTGIAGETLVWAWTSGFYSPSNDTDTLDLTAEAEEVVVLRVQITALERVLATKEKSAVYFALTVREGVTEQDLSATLDALHASLQQRMQSAVKRPDRQG